ncbi:uncharacterized protein LOC125000894 isoform X2 [Mugil cephalus]|uniref:uncharacterized protein LOC125000894 isoform X2 n=1 Tax=Mugil cephalus TaxID=48193 RepID=UPI001FB7EDAA|nr:uncharacterized protein LOC125000894 isoform X2 [Mugil cephalus]
MLSPGCCVVERLGENLTVWTQGKLGVMGASWGSWRTAIAFIITTLQIQALTNLKPMDVTGVEGHRFDFRCEYPNGWENNAKHFSRIDDGKTVSHLIRTETHDQWESEGRFSLYDNTSAAFFIVRVDRLSLEDSGIYLCGVDISHFPDHISAIQLDVSQGHHLTLLLTAAMCVAAIVFVCLFTCCLLLTVKQRRSEQQQQQQQQQNREISSDYESMTPGVTTQPEFHCSCSVLNYNDLPALPLPPADSCRRSTSNQRDSEVSLGLNDYADVDVPGPICPYQHLDHSQLEEHVYYSLQGSGSPKLRPAKDSLLL